MAQSKYIKNFSGLYRQNGGVQDPYFFTEKIKTRAVHFDWKVDPHFHSRLFQIFLVRKGYAKAYLNAQQYLIEGSFLIFIPPGVIHGFDFDADIDGDIISFSSYYANALISKFAQLTGQLSKPVMITDQTHTASEIGALFESFYRLRDVYGKEKSTLSEVFIYVKVADLLLQIADMQSAKPVVPSSAPYSDLELFKSFQDLVKNEISPFKPLEEYARRLNTSLSHINRICRQVENASPLTIIQNEIIMMAKTLLVNEKINISDIAYSLGFNDPSYFIRLFKKKVGVTPKLFRKQNIA